MNKTLLCFLMAFLTFGMMAQKKTKTNLTPIKRCVTHEKMMEIRALDPDAYDKKIAEEEQKLQQWISENYQSKVPTIYTIPVVVQIFGTTANNAVTDNRVYEQIDVLTQDYRRLNSDTGNTPATFKSIAADVEFEFCLATVDPQGNATTGIVRKTGSTSPSQSDLWNTNQYLNLLVYNIGGGTLGFTQLPSTNTNYGVHISYQYFGKTGTTAPYNKGRTATHEVGHWFNLEHIWGDANCGNDNVSDTPEQDSEHYNCPSHPYHVNACGAGTSPNGEMFMNYMDYTPDNCMNIFSQGQKTRMVSALNQYRSGLINNGKCGATSVVADFTGSPTTLFAGNSVDFTDLSTGNPTSWSWTFNGGTPASSTQQNPQNIVYSTAGTYDVTLTVSDGTTSDTKTKLLYITVIPPGTQLCDSVSGYKSTDTPSLIGSGGWGYVTGHNDYDDRAKADFFTAPDSGYKLVGAKFWFAVAYAGSSTSTLDVKIWSDNAGTPGPEIYSQTIQLDSLSIYPSETYIDFDSSLILTDDFYLGVQFAANGTPQDTVALISNNDGETNPGTAWELWSDNAWHAMSETPASWGINISQAIWAVLCMGDAVSAREIYSDNSLLIFPNPSDGKFNVRINKYENVQIEIYNVLGEKTHSHILSSTNSLINLSSLPPGIYFAEISTDEKTVVKKISITK